MDQVGRYEIIGKLGQGGQSIALKARDPQIDRLVAIKLVRETGHLTDDGRLEFSTRFFREAQAAGRLSHPNIATIYDVGDDDGRPFIAMEYVEGETLNKLVSRDHPLEPGVVVGIFQQLCAALQYAHNSGVIHRDIKPENIMVTPSGQVKVVDFGVARLPASTLTQDGRLLGTPSYMSPEQVQGHRVDHRSDIFSLGVVLYEALTGERPFDGDHPTTVIFKIVSDEQRPARDVVPELDTRFDDILAKALAKKKDERYESCAEMSRDLEALADSIPTVPAISTVSATTVVSEAPDDAPTLVGTAPAAQPAPQTPEWLSNLREQAGLLVLGGLLVILTGLLAIWWMSEGPPPVAEVAEPAPFEFVGPLPPEGWTPPPPGAEPDAEEPATAQPAAVAAVRPADTDAPSLPAPPPEPREQTRPQPIQQAPAPPTPAELQAQALLAFREGRFADAATTFEQLATLQPNSGETHYFLGLSLARTAGPPAALDPLERAVELRPEDPLFRIQLALNLEKAGRGQLAAVHLKRAVELGGHPEFDAETLRDHVLRLEAEAELSQLEPYEIQGTHDHFIGGCEGRLSLTRSHLSFVTGEEGHSVDAPVTELRQVTSESDRLAVVLPDGKKLNFDIGDPGRASRIFELVKQLEGLKPRP